MEPRSGSGHYGPQLGPSARAALVTLGAIPVVLLAASSGQPIGGLFAILLNYVALFTTFAFVPRAFSTPAVAISLIISTFGLAGYAFYGELADRGYVPAALAVDDMAVRQEALTWFMLASFATLAGAWATRGSAAHLHAKVKLNAVAAVGNPAFAITFALASAGLNLAVRNIQDLIERSFYRIDTPIGGFMTYLQLPAAFLLGQCFLRNRWYTKLACTGLMVFFVVFSIALSSRLLSVTVLMFFIGLGMSARRLRAVPVAAGVLLAAISIPLPLYLRGLPEQGLGPNLSALSGFSFLSGDSFWVITGNLLSSFNVVALTGSVEAIPWSSFAESVFPLPGFVGVASSVSDLRINFAVPYAGLGEIANHGAAFLTVTFGLLGLVAGFVERATRRYQERFGVTPGSIVPLGIAILCGFLFVQYNLASAMRFAYLLMLIGVWLFFKSRRGPVPSVDAPSGNSLSV